MNLNGILMGSDNPERLVEYYTRLFGEPGWKDQSYSGWQLGNGSLMIGAHSEVHGQSEQPGRIIVNFESEDVRGDFARLRDAGAIVVREPYNFEEYPDVWIATLADPDGNYFQLVPPFDPATMGGDAE